MAPMKFHSGHLCGIAGSRAEMTVCPVAGFVYRIASTRAGAPNNIVLLVPSMAPTKSRQLSTFVWNELLIEVKSSGNPPIRGSPVSSPPCSSSADIGDAARSGRVNDLPRRGRRVGWLAAHIASHCGDGRNTR